MAVLTGLQELPHPGLCQLEIQFRRLLNQCTARTLQHSTSQPGLGDWRTDPKYHCHIELLQEKLYDLQSASSEDRPSPETLELYQQHVRTLAAELRPPDLPAFCKSASAQDQRAPAAALAGSVPPRTPTGATAEWSASPAGAAAAAAAAAAEGGGGAAAGTAAGPAGAPGAMLSLSSTAKQRLQTQQRLQDELTSELLDMTQDLKASAVAMHNAIRYRGAVLDETEGALDTSTVNAQAVAAKAKAQHARGRRNFCTTCLILLAVGAIFTGMLVYIRVTSFVGLGQKKGGW